MNFKLPALVAFLFVMLGQQISYAQNGCVPTGTTTSSMQLNQLQIGDVFNYEVVNFKRYNLMKQNLVLDAPVIPVQLNFTNPSGETFYVGMYLDKNQDGVYSYPGEMIYYVETNAIEHNGNMTLSLDVIAAIQSSDPWFRTIVTHDPYFIQNTCQFPSITKPYQALETNLSKLKIKRTTAHDTIFECLEFDADMFTDVNFQNLYEENVNINQVTLRYGRRGNQTACNNEPYLASMETTMPYTMEIAIPNYILNVPSFLMQYEQDESLLHSIDPNCWDPTSNLILFVEINFTRTIEEKGQPPVSVPGTSTNWFTFGDVINCLPQDPRLAGPNTPSEVATHIFPNPGKGECYLNIQIPESGNIQYRILNLMGQEVRRMNNEIELPAGESTLSLPTTGLESGTYFLQILLDNNEVIAPTKLIISN